jgi:hypothetical protein
MDLLKETLLSDMLLQRFPNMASVKVQQRLRTGLNGRPADHGKYAVTIVEDDGVELFLTPRTRLDDEFWPAGLDGTASVHDCIALFDDIEQARRAVSQWEDPSKCVYYQLAVASPSGLEQVLELTAVSVPRALTI